MVDAGQGIAASDCRYSVHDPVPPAPLPGARIARRSVNSGTGEADALSWQASFSFMDVLPDHDFGLVYGRVADGWLLSSDFRPNDELLEARWVWQASKCLAARRACRRREEIDPPVTAARPRRDDDLYLRATWKF